MEKYIGKEVKGFKFSNGPGFVNTMEKYVGQTGKITAVRKDSFTVRFSNGESWAYPYPEILKHLEEKEEEEINLEEVLEKIRNLKL